MPQGLEVRLRRRTAGLRPHRPDRRTHGAAGHRSPARRHAQGPDRRPCSSIPADPAVPASTSRAAAAGRTTSAPQVKRHFDLVTWDPRGVGESTPALRCAATDQARDAPRRSDGPYSAPRTTKELNGTLRTSDSLAASCHRQRTARHPRPSLLPHMSTMENVRDLDRLRMAFHDPKLNYFGVSYGTTIGAVYRNVFPNTVRSMVLHGVVDNPARFNDFRRYVVSDAYESNRTMSAMLMACDRAGPVRMRVRGRRAVQVRPAHQAPQQHRRRWRRFPPGVVADRRHGPAPSATRSGRTSAARRRETPGLYQAVFPTDGRRELRLPQLKPVPEPPSDSAPWLPTAPTTPARTSRSSPTASTSRSPRAPRPDGPASGCRPGRFAGRWLRHHRRLRDLPQPARPLQPAPLHRPVEPRQGPSPPPQRKPTTRPRPWPGPSA
ncbi:alpha/beta fold hydrolase [Streptomyces sp. KL116D]|uniref:alpha/beta fold hydrolase n=1 Tax=Streptomyces sp. KL116D TaxID=3045152 RepID=UPI003556FF6A